MPLAGARQAEFTTFDLAICIVPALRLHCSCTESASLMHGKSAVFPVEYKHASQKARISRPQADSG
jgi:hypothetical protein